MEQQLDPQLETADQVQELQVLVEKASQYWVYCFYENGQPVVHLTVYQIFPPVLLSSG